MIIVVSGPGGAGKGTIVSRLIEDDPQLHLSRSWTTRARRPHETDDDYEFVDRAAFEARIESKGFLEWADFLGNYYGTPVPDDDLEGDLLLEIDVQGAAQVCEIDPSVLLIFIEAPSRAAQEARLRGRGDAEDIIARRLAKADSEADAGRELGARVIINDDLDRAVNEVAEVISAERRRRD